MTKENCIRRILHKDGAESWHYKDILLPMRRLTSTCSKQSEEAQKTALV